MPEGLFKPDQLNIRDLTIEAPTTSPELQFDVETIFTDENWRALAEEIDWHLRTGSNIEDGLQAYLFASVLKPEIRKIIELDDPEKTTKLQQFIDSRTGRTGMQDLNKYGSLAPIRFIRPDLTVRFPGSRSLARSIANKADDYLTNPGEKYLGLCAYGAATLISPLVREALLALTDLATRERLINMANSLLEYLADESTAEAAAMLRIFLETAQDAIRLTDDMRDILWKELKGYVEGGDLIKAVKLAASLKILVAKSVHVTENGFEITMPEAPAEQEVQELPEQRRY